MKLMVVRQFILIYVLLTSFNCFSQNGSEGEHFLSKLVTVQSPPDGLLSSRSVVLYSMTYSQAELEDIQKGFQQMGIDAVSYVESERALAGFELINAYGRYFAKRDIKVLIFLRKSNDEYAFNFVPFAGSANWTKGEQSAWFVHGPTLRSTLENVFRPVIASQKKQNFLVNDYPERRGPLNALHGDRNETLAPNLKSLKFAIPRFGDAEADKQLALANDRRVQIEGIVLIPNPLAPSASRDQP